MSVNLFPKLAPVELQQANATAYAHSNDPCALWQAILSLALDVDVLKKRVAELEQHQLTATQ